MNEKQLMTVHTVAEKTGITVRTLHYYDEIGLLPPTNVSESKYRLYSAEDLERLQQILFFREAGFGLKEIRQILSAPSYSKRTALKNQIKILKEKQKRTDTIIRLIEEKLAGETESDFSAFKETALRSLQESYRREVLEQWGKTDAFRQFAKNARGNNNFNTKLEEAAKSIFSGIFLHMNQSPDSPQVQALIHLWRNTITENFYDCTIPIFRCLGQMYISDDRFFKTIAGYGDSRLPDFISRAVTVYCDRHAKGKKKPVP